MLAFNPLRSQPEETGHRLVEIKDSSSFINHQHAILDGVEKRLQKAPFPRQPLNDRLQTFGIETANAPQHPIKKTGFARRLHRPAGSIKANAGNASMVGRTVRRCLDLMRSFSIWMGRMRRMGRMSRSGVDQAS